MKKVMIIIGVIILVIVAVVAALVIKGLIEAKKTSVKEDTCARFCSMVRLKSPIILLRMRSVRLWSVERTGFSLTLQRARIPALLSIPLWKQQRRTELILTLTCCAFCRCSRILGRVHQTRSLISFFRGTKECVTRCCENLPALFG